VVVKRDLLWGGKKGNWRGLVVRSQKEKRVRKFKKAAMGTQEEFCELLADLGPIGSLQNKKDPL